MLTRSLLNPLAIENRMFLDNLAPIKEEVERYQNEKLEKERRLKRI